LFFGSDVVLVGVAGAMAGLGEKIKQTVEHGVNKVGGKGAAGKRILIVATSHDKLGDSDQPTGCW